MDKSPQILIAENDRTAALEMTRALKVMGYDVPAIVSSGENAVEQARGLRPDLVLMDTALEGEMSGAEAAGQIHTHLDIPVVYVTSDISEAGIEEIKRTQPFGCVFKPFRDAELQAVVGIALYKHAEEKQLRESEKQLRLIAENMRDMVRLTDMEGKNLYFSPSHTAVLGYTAEERVGRSNFELVHPDDMGRVQQIFIEALARSKPERAEYRARHTDGHYIWVETLGDFIYDDEGRVTGILMSTRDVTERRAMEAALRESEEKYRRILEEMEDGYWETDLAGRITVANDALCRIAGVARDEILSGVRFSNYADSETKKRIYGIFMEVYRTGKSADVEDYEILRNDGSRRTLAFNVSLIRDKDGDPAGFRGITRDVTERKTMENSLRESEESYRNVLELAPDAIAIVRGADARYLQVNDAFCRQTGYTAGEIIGRTSSSLNLYADPDDRKRLFDIVAREGRVDGIEIQYQAKDGTILDNLVSARPIHFRGEGCFLVVATLVTSLKKAERAFRRSEERYRTILESIEDGYWETDLAGRFTFFNDALCRSVGLPPEKLRGLKSLEHTTPETSKRLYSIFNKVYRTGKPANIVDYEFATADGSIAIHELSVSLMRDDEGKPVGFRGISRDATERREMERALQESEEKYRTILESIEDGYWEIDLAGRFTFFNDALCRLMGFSREELPGMSNLQYTDSETAKRLYGVFNEVYRTGRPASIVDYDVIRKDKSREALDLSVSLMRDKDGNPVGFRGVSRNITPRKQAEEEIRTHREHLALINQILRHDLTNDLLVVHKSLELYEQSPEEDILKEASGRVKKSLDLISRMREIEAFMSFHKELQVYKIRDVISAVARDHPSIDFVIKGKARVMADESLFSVIDNIARNAFIHGKADRIEVTIDRQKDMCEVRIADNGSGIPDEIKEKIFEEGFIHGDTGQTGLGLHIVKKAMENYGGYVYARDNEPKGTVFALKFRMVE